MQEALRQENYQLKNEITDLKNAFDLNRDILKILSTYSVKSDPQQHLLMQIITRLTTVNNQAMINVLELIQQKNILKQENLRLNLELKAIQQKFAQQLQNTRILNQPTESRIVFQQQFSNLNRELMAANQERIAKEQEIQYWRKKFQTQQKQLREDPNAMHDKVHRSSQKNQKINRKYTSNEGFKYELLFHQKQKQNKRQRQYIEELQNRLILFIKVYKLSGETDQPRQNGNTKIPYFQTELEQIKLLKYALNDIQVQRKQDDFILTITERFKAKDSMNNVYFKDRRSFSWPKNKISYKSEDQCQDDETGRMRERLC